VIDVQSFLLVVVGFIVFVDVVDVILSCFPIRARVVFVSNTMGGVLLRSYEVFPMSDNTIQL